MPTQEEYNQAQVELDIANDNYAATQDKINKYNEIFKAFKNASPETQAKAEASWLMQRALDDYNSLKAQQYVNEDRINVAQNRMNTYREAAAAQYIAAQQAASGWRTKRRVIKEDRQWPEVIVNEDWWTPIYNDKWEIVWWQWPIENLNRPITLQWPDNTVRYTSNFVPNQSMINAQLWAPWTLSQWKWTTAWEYLWNVWQGITENINPSTRVYQNNSRAPWYNLWRTIWNAVIPLTAMYWSSTLWPSQGWSSNVVNPWYTGAPKISTSTPKFVNNWFGSATRASLRRRWLSNLFWLAGF